MSQGPTLMVVGAPKSGSTALFSYLADHPDLRAHSHREMPFFGRDDEWSQGWSAALGKYFPGEDVSARLVAKHTMAMYDPVAMERISRHTSAVVVAVLRDPVPRAYSHYNYARLRGWEDADTFEEGLRREASRPVSRPPRARDLQYVGDGIYSPRVQHLLEVLPPERRRVYLADDLRSDPQRVCSEVFALAGLPPHRADVTQHHNEARRPRSDRFARAFLAAQQPGSPARLVAKRFLSSRALYRARSMVNRMNETSTRIPPMDPTVEAELRRRFAGPNAALEEVLGRRVGWAL